MCTCPPHLVEIAQQSGAALPFLGIVGAMIAGSRFGVWILQLRRKFSRRGRVEIA